MTWVGVSAEELYSVLGCLGARGIASKRAVDTLSPDAHPVALLSGGGGTGVSLTSDL